MKRKDGTTSSTSGKPKKSKRRHSVPQNEIIDINEDNRVIDEINRDKLSTAPLHTEFKRLKWRAEDRAEAKNMGIAVKTGRFTKEEELILTRNWHQFCDDFIVDNPYTVLGYYHNNLDTSQAERKGARETIRRSEMYLRLAKDLPNRPLLQIYQRARKLFSGLNKSKNLTEEDRKLIIEMSQKGLKGGQIAHIFFADIKTVDEVLRRNINRSHNTIYKKSTWSKKEDRKLKKIISKMLHGESEAEDNENDQDKSNDPKPWISDISEISWADVSQMMGNRSDHSCREHFYTITFGQVYDPEHTYKSWNKSQSTKLVYFLHTRDYPKEADIDWDEIKDLFSDFKFFQITNHWRKLKRKIDGADDMKFPQLVQRLYAKYVEIRSKKYIKELDQFARPDYIA